MNIEKITEEKIAAFRETVPLMEQAIKAACSQFGVGMPQIRFSNRMTSAAGKATKTMLTFSIPLLLRTTRAECIETAVHEAAHFIDYQIRGTSDHGAKWRNLMAQLGYPNAQRCHQIDRSDMARFFIACSKCKKQLRTYTRRPTLNVHRYRSRCCDARLQVYEVVKQ